MTNKNQMKKERDLSYLNVWKKEYEAKRDLITEQVCTKCQKCKPINEFGKRKLSSGIWGYEKQCKECRNPMNRMPADYYKEYFKKHPEYAERQRKPKVKKNCAFCGNEFEGYKHNKYCSKECNHNSKLHPKIKSTEDELKANRKEYRKRIKEQDREKYRLKRKEYRKRAFERDPYKVRARRQQYKNNRKVNDINYRFAENLRKKVYLTLKKSKSLHTIELLGCSVDYARKHIENQFKEGMTWNNWALDGWHIDHIIPISSFDLTSIEEQKQCFHYTNLQPLWWKDNIRKSNKIEEKQLVLI